jgi:RNA polymerase sigma-70 factor (ECF subfamily)
LRAGGLDAALLGPEAWDEAGAPPLTHSQDAREPDLLRLARNGDARAFQALVDRHRPRVEAVAWRLTRDPRLADEVAQDAFVRMHTALPSFREDAAIATWLYRIVVNLCHDHARRVARDRSIPIDEAPPLPSHDDLPDASAEAAERTRVIDSLVQSLPAPMREAVVLRYAGGLAYDEIAATLGCPPGTVASRIHRALRVIGLMLETRGIREDSL